MDEIEHQFNAAFKSIEAEITRTPESERGRLQFLKRCLRAAANAENEIDEYRGSLRPELGTEYEYYPEGFVPGAGE